MVDPFSQVFHEYSESLLVPPSRRLETRTKIDPAQEVQPNGQGVLNALFLARNQMPGSPKANQFQLLADAFEEISDGYRFWIEANAGGKLSLFFSRGAERWDFADECGLGLQHLLIMLYFVVTAEVPRLCIEEPENHLHPQMQRQLALFLKEKTDKQYFITTHSNVFLGSRVADTVFLTEHRGASIGIREMTSPAAALASLGYQVADNLVADLLILLEGPKDIPVIQELLRKKGVDQEIKALALGGDIMDTHDLSIFKAAYKTTALIDRDPGSSPVRRRFVEACERAGITVHRLERYALENYFPVRALRAVFKGQIAADLDTVKPDLKLFDQIGIDVKNNNAKLAAEMELDDIAGTDLATFLDDTVRMLA